jgi:hypothetical protein
MISTKTKYGWRKQKDGRYDILGVDIFQLYKSERGEVSKNDAELILQGFADKKNKDWLPRVHIGHQDYASSANQKGIGYIDALRLCGDTFFADIIDLSEEDFKAFINRKYPYRSVEYDPIQKEIVGLAMLESKPPHFEFPVMQLEHYGRKTSNIVIFSTENIMPEEKIGEKIEETPVGETPIGEKEEVDALLPEEIKGLRGLLPLLPLIDKIKQMFEEKEEEEPIQNQDAVLAQEPSIMAFQKLFDRIEKRLDGFEKKHASINIYSKLRSICDTNSSINFEKEKSFLEQFSDDSSREVYINRLSNKDNNFEPHVITQFAKSFEGHKEDLKQFENLSGEKRTVFLKAKQDYMDTIHQPNEKAAMQFSKRYPSIEAYVWHALNALETNGYNPVYKK